MYKFVVFTATILLSTFASAENERPSYFYPAQYRTNFETIKNGPYAVQHRNFIETQEPFVDDNYEYTVISKDEYPLAEQDSYENSIYSLITAPITALSVLGSKALILFKFLLPKAALVLLGVAMVFGVCAFTPFCTITIESPFAIDIPYLDFVEDFFSEAYAKYENMQLFK